MNVELEKDVYNQLSQACASRPRDTMSPWWSQGCWAEDSTLNRKALVQWLSILAASENYLQEFVKVRKKE